VIPALAETPVAVCYHPTPENPGLDFEGLATGGRGLRTCTQMPSAQGVQRPGGV